MFDHKSVLEAEVTAGLALKPDGTYVDCTTGGGGHSEKIAARLNNNGLLLAFDQDWDALKAARQRLHPYKDCIRFIHANFRELEKHLVSNNIGAINGILFDLGVSSPQFDHGERGFSYQHNARLDMRMNQDQKLDAQELVNNWSYEKLVWIFFHYGEEKFSKQIARKIETVRKVRPINTTYELVDIIKEAIPAPARRKGGHPAKRVFQALRIAVNDELGAFSDALHQAARLVAIGGRIAVISFHSLEDRVCKQAFKKWSTAKPVPQNLPVIPDDHQPPFKLVNKKPIVPTEKEQVINRRSHSAKLRIAEKIADWDDEFTYKKGWQKS